jgi:hypothetical protein
MLLVLNVLVGRGECVVYPLGGVEKRTVDSVGPTALVNGIDAVVWGGVFRSFLD